MQVTIKTPEEIEKIRSFQCLSVPPSGVLSVTIDIEMGSLSVGARSVGGLTGVAATMSVAHPGYQ